MIWLLLAAFSNVYDAKKYLLYLGCVYWVWCTGPWYLAVNLFPKDNFQWDLPQSNGLQDLILHSCHIQNDSFFTSSSRKIEERGKVISLCTTTPFLQRVVCHRAMSRAQGGTGQMLLGNSTPLTGIPCRLSIQRDGGRGRQRHTRMIVCVWPC